MNLTDMEGAAVAVLEQGKEYILSFGFTSDAPMGGRTLVNLIGGGEDDELFAKAVFDAEDGVTGENEETYQVSLPFTAQLDLAEGSYSLEAVTETESGVKSVSDALGFGFSNSEATMDVVDIELTSVSIAEPQLSASDDAIFEVSFGNLSSRPQLSDYTLVATIGSVTDASSSQEAATVTLGNIDPMTSSTETVSVSLSALASPLEPGSYELSFEISPQDTNEADADPSNNSASALIYVEPADLAERPRESGDLDGDKINDVLIYNAESGNVGSFP